MTTPEAKMYLSLIITEKLSKVGKNFYEELYEIHDIYKCDFSLYYFNHKRGVFRMKTLDFIRLF